MKLLVAIDGSRQSMDVVHTLAHFTPPEELTLVHAVPLPDLDHPMITPELRDSVVQELEDKLRHAGETLLDRAISTLPSDCKNQQRIQQIGSPARVLLETAKSAKPDLIILGARGLGPIKELVLGSVSHRVVLHAPCSTLVMKSPLPKLRKVLLPVEGVEDADVALKFLANNPFRGPIEVEIMTVWPQPLLPWPVTWSQTTELEKRALEHAQDRVETLSAKLKSIGYECTSCIRLGDPAYAILEQQRTNKPDLILMGSHGRRGVSRFLLGSVSHAILHNAECPVLIVR